MLSQAQGHQGEVQVEKLAEERRSHFFRVHELEGELRRLQTDHAGLSGRVRSRVSHPVLCRAPALFGGAPVRCWL